MEKINYTITYDSNGGSTCSPKTVANGSTYGSLCEPTKTGYKFEGWYTSLNGGTKITSSTIASSDTTIYAHWTPNTYKLTFNENYQKDDMRNWNFQYQPRFSITYDSSSNMNTVAVAGASGWEILYLPIGTINGREYQLSFDYEVPSAYTALSGYNGVGYQILRSINDTDNSANAITSGNIPASVTSSKVNKTLTFTGTGGTVYFAFNFGMAADGVTTTLKLGNINIYSSTTKSYGSTLETLPSTTRTGYTFDGWYTSATGGNQISSSTTVPAENITYYAHWIPINLSIDTNPVINGSIYNSGSAGFTYNVKVNGVQVATNVQDYWATVPYGGTLELIPNGVTGYNAYSFSKVIYDSSAVSGPTWNGITYYIAYDGNMASYGSTATTTCTYGVNCNLTANGFSRTDYNFEGWAINSPNAAATYSNQQTVSNLTTTNGATIMMYAKWVGVWKSYTATFNYVIDANHNFSLIGNSATYTTSCNFQVPNNSCSAPTPGLAFGSSATSGNMLDLFNITWGGVAYLSNAVTLTGNTTLTLVVSSKYANNGSVLKGGKNNAWVRKGAAVNGTLSNDQKYGYIRSDYKAYWADGDYRIGTTNHLVWVKGYGYGVRCKTVGEASDSSCNSKSCDSTSCRVPSGSTNGWISLKSLRW